MPILCCLKGNAREFIHEFKARIFYSVSSRPAKATYTPLSNKQTKQNKKCFFSLVTNIFVSFALFYFRVLLRVRMLYYLKQEVIGNECQKVFDGVDAR